MLRKFDKHNLMNTPFYHWEIFGKQEDKTLCGGLLQKNN